jgi:threonine/homoserine/homoserine lactone efflux protein
MTYAENLWIYFVLLLGIIIVPGMDSLFVLANSLTGGRKLGLAAVAGIMLGGVFHTVFGAAGAGVITGLPMLLFNTLLLAGAGYMVWIGMTLLKSSITVGPVGAATTRSLGMAFRQGAITCMLNPKAYLFTIAVYPQFIRPEFGRVAPQALVMGIMTVLMQLAIYGGLAVAAARAQTALVTNPKATMLIGRTVGLFFILAAGYTAWHGWRG